MADPAHQTTVSNGEQQQQQPLEVTPISSRKKKACAECRQQKVCKPIFLLLSDVLLSLLDEM